MATRSKPPKRKKRKISESERERLRALREKHGLGEYRNRPKRSRLEEVREAATKPFGRARVVGRLAQYGLEDLLEEPEKLLDFFIRKPSLRRDPMPQQPALPNSDPFRPQLPKGVKLKAASVKNPNMPGITYGGINIWDDESASYPQFSSGYPRGSQTTSSSSS